MSTIRENQQRRERVISSWYKPYILFIEGTAQRSTGCSYKRQFHPLSSRWFWSTKKNAPVEHSIAYILLQGANVQQEELSNELNGCQGTSYMCTQNKNTCKMHFRRRTWYRETHSDARSISTTAVYQSNLLEALGKLKESGFTINHHNDRIEYSQYI